MKLAFSTLGCPHYTIDQIVETAKRLGFDGVGIRTVSGTTDLGSLEAFSPAGIQATGRKFAAAGVRVICMSSGVRFVSPDSTERNKHLQAAKDYIDMAVAVEAPFIRIFGGPIAPEADTAQTITQIVEGFQAVGEYAKDRGVTALLETHDSFSTGKSVAELFARVHHPGIASVWDILHSLRFGESFEETWRQIGPTIKNIHIKDSVKFDEKGFDIALCGEGGVPIVEAVRTAQDNGYDGYYEFEWEKGWHPEIPEAEVAFPHYVRYMRELAARL